MVGDRGLFAEQAPSLAVNAIIISWVVVAESEYRRRVIRVPAKFGMA